MGIRVVTIAVASRPPPHYMIQTKGFESHVNAKSALIASVKSVRALREATKAKELAELEAQGLAPKADAAAAGEAAGPKLLLRVCQVLVLPPYQAAGHGAQLLNTIYEYAGTQTALEVSVEDPSPQFRLLRDLTDVRRCARLKLMVPTAPGTAPTPAELREAKIALRITDEQARLLPRLSSTAKFCTPPSYPSTHTH